MNRTIPTTISVLAALWQICGCIGEFGDGLANGARPSPSPTTPPSTSSTDPVTQPEPAQFTTVECSSIEPKTLKRLTRVEYDHTVQDLLGLDATVAATTFPPDPTVLGFAIALQPSELAVEKYVEAAESLASQAPLASLLPCDTANRDDACARRFITQFGRRAYRRPLTQTEVDALFDDVYRKARTDSEIQANFANAVRLVIRAILASPHFLYRIERGQPSGADGDGPVLLTSLEIASRLSYLLWSSMPDEQLLAAAERDELRDAEAVAAQARRMLADPKAARALRSFVAQWLALDQLDHLERDDPAFTPTLARSMREETETFIAHVLLEDGRLPTLFNAAYSFIDSRLAEHYGISAAGTGGFSKVPLDTRERLGLLTQASLMTINAHSDQTSPVHRGLLVRDRLMCQPPPPPPDNVDATVPAVDPNVSTRERFAAHRSDSACAGCHDRIDPIGFAFEHYDPIGRYRASEGTVPIDASGEIIDSRDLDGTFDGALELSRKLAESEQVSDCVLTQYYRFAYGHDGDAEGNCSMLLAQQALSASGGSFPEMVVAFVQTDAFRYRRGRSTASLRRPQ
jgi:hypothetical protein